MAVKIIQPQQLRQWLCDGSRSAPLLLDVREVWEVEICCFEESLHIPMQSIPARLSELDPESQTVVVCHHGGRSFQVAAWLESRGFASVYNLAGGMDGWARQVDQSMAVY